MLSHILRELILFIRHKIFKIDDRSQLEIAIDNGLKIGNECNIMGECIIDPSHCWLIEIGDRVTMAPKVHVLAHDASTKRILGYTRINRTIIGNDVFIGAGAIILPGITIGDNVIIGAGSIVSKNIPRDSVAVGNPARVICDINTYVRKKQEEFNSVPHFDSSYVIGNISEEKKNEMNKLLIKNKAAYII